MVAEADADALVLDYHLLRLYTASYYSSHSQNTPLDPCDAQLIVPLEQLCSLSQMRRRTLNPNRSMYVLIHPYN